MKNELVMAIAAKARAVLKVKTESKELPPLHKELQEFFNKTPFDCQSEKAAELVGILTGFKPIIKKQPAVDLFDCFYYGGDIKKAMIVVGSENNYRFGWCPGQSNCLYHDANCRKATPEESEAVIAALEKETDAKFIKWTIEKLGSRFLPTIVALES